MPFHQGRDISPTLLRQIAKDIGLSVEDFLAGEQSQQLNKPQSSSVEPPAPKKSSDSGRG